MARGVGSRFGGVSACFEDLAANSRKVVFEAIQRQISQALALASDNPRPDVIASGNAKQQLAIGLAHDEAKSREEVLCFFKSWNLEREVIDRVYASGYACDWLCSWSFSLDKSSDRCAGGRRGGASRLSPEDLRENASQGSSRVGDQFICSIGDKPVGPNEYATVVLDLA
jgi:hypothetical protein